MENELRHQLLAVSAAFAQAEQCGLSMVSRRCRNDSGFFHRLADESKSFTARTFDEVMRWFSEHWPDGHAWPEGIDRPDVNAVSSPSVSDSPSHAGGPSADPIPEISESPTPVHGPGGHVVTPSPVGG